MKQARRWLEEQHGASVTTLDVLPGGAGARRYWRVVFADGRRAVLMHAVPEDRAILPPALRDPGHELPFVTLTGWLAALGVLVPELYAVDLDERLVLLEDLGDTHLCDLDGPAREARLEEAIRALARLHRDADAQAFPFPDRRFDQAWVRFELDTFERHGLAGHPAPGAVRALDRLAREIAALPHVVCLRDYQSQNLMVDELGRLRVLDYQDALLAPAELDAVALLYDSYVEIGSTLRTRLVDAYVAERGTALDPTALALLTVQRKCKDFGRYRYVVEVRGDARYAHYQDRALAAVHEGLAALPAELAELRAPLAAALGDPS